MRALGRLLLTFALCCLFAISACSRSVESETRRWESNVGEVKGLMAQYPGLQPALETRLAEAQKLHDAAEGLGDEAKVKKLGEANAALQRGLVTELAKLEKSMKTLRERRVEAAAMAGDESTRLGAKVAAEDAQKALDRVASTLETGAPDEAGALALVKKAQEDIATALKAVDKVLEADGKKRESEKAEAEQGKADAEAAKAAEEAKVANWTCSYCDTSNTHDKTACGSCGAPRSEK